MRPAAGEPEGALVLLHGRGADEHDLLPFLDVLDPHRRLVGHHAGRAADAPAGGRHWYVVERVGFPDHDTFHASFDAALRVPRRAARRRSASRGSASSSAGFSQGGVMSYATGLGAGSPARRRASSR